MVWWFSERGKEAFNSPVINSAFLSEPVLPAVNFTKPSSFFSFIYLGLVGLNGIELHVSLLPGGLNSGNTLIG